MNDFKMSRYTQHSALSNQSEVKRLKRFKFRGVHISHQVRKARQRLFPREVKTRSPPSSPAHHLLPVSHRGLHTGGSPTVATAAECVTGSLLPIHTNICTDQLQKKAVVFPKSIHTMDTLFSFSSLWEKMQDNKNQNKHEETASTMSC